MPVKLSTRVSKRQQALVGIWLLIVLLMLPNLVWLFYSQAVSTWVTALILPLILIAALFALLGRVPWLACLLIAPFAVLAPLEAFYIANFRVPSTPRVIATIRATNLEETRTFLGPHPLLLVVIPLLALVLALLTSRWAFASRLRWRGKLPACIALVTIAIPVAMALTGLVSAKGPLNKRLHAASQPLQAAAQIIQQSYPFGLPERFRQYQRNWRATHSRTRRLDQPQFLATRTRPQPEQRQVYVLVIGESSARGHWQLYGYHRPTNPALSQQHNLIVLQRMITSWPETIAAVPTLLTRKPITSSKPDWQAASFLRPMQEAGFQTWWISNQYPLQRSDSPVAAYVYQSNRVVWVNHDKADVESNSYDGDLIPPLKHALRASARDLFVVLHMMGSHRQYNNRYPPAFARFTPTQADTTQAPKKGPDRLRRIRNSYDNSILYTDHVLKQIIQVLEHSHAVTALWYESDHGELLPSATCDKNGHGFGTRHEYEIPTLFWYSGAYAQHFPDRVEALRANAGKRSLSADTFESLIDMAGVTFLGHDKGWSLFSPEWRYHPRIVGQTRQTNFDTAQFGPNCGTVRPAAASRR